MPLDILLNSLKINRFEPTKHSESIIPNSPGNYIICLAKGCHLPKSAIMPIYNQFENFDVLYIGISKSLKSRDYHQHFNGNAGGSTLRKSLGVLFEYKLVPRDKNLESKKTKFSVNNELTLSHWMHRNLILFFHKNEFAGKDESILINYFNPPLNIRKNKNLINMDFRNHLSNLRSKR